MQRMKNTEHEIVEMVYAAKTDTAAADLLIQKYLGFIRAEMVKAVRRPQNGYEDEERDKFLDELSNCYEKENEN